MIYLSLNLMIVSLSKKNLNSRKYLCQYWIGLTKIKKRNTKYKAVGHPWGPLVKMPQM